MDKPPQKLGELRQHLLDKWREIPIKRLQHLVASMSRRLAAIIAGIGGDTRYWPGIHKTTPTGSIMQKKQVCLIRFITITLEWHLGVIMQSLSPISQIYQNTHETKECMQYMKKIHNFDMNLVARSLCYETEICIWSTLPPGKHHQHQHHGCLTWRRERSGHRHS